METTEKKDNVVAKAVRTEVENMSSVRVRVLYGVTAIWTFCVFYFITLFSKFASKLDDVTKVQVMTMVADKCMGIFYVCSFLFFVMMMVYVLKRTNFKFSAWGISLDLSDNTKPPQPPPKQGV